MICGMSPGRGGRCTILGHDPFAFAWRHPAYYQCTKNEMVTRRIAHFERFILVPLDWVLTGLALLYLILGAWMVGIFLVFACICSSILGASLHKDKSRAQLAHGDHITEGFSESDPRHLSSGESITLARLTSRLSLLCGITTMVLLFHHGYHWYLTVPAGVMVGIFWYVVLFVFLLSEAKQAKRRIFDDAKNSSNTNSDKRVGE